MDQETIEAIAQASKIETTVATEGWQLLRKMIEDQVLELQSIDKIQTLKELQARQVAVKALRGFLQDVDAICTAKLDYEKGNAVKKLRDPILRVLK
jgi:hypothetical protein